MTAEVYVFRTDASLEIGTGHVMRCLTLADALKSQGAICKFISREHPGNLINYIQQRGFEVFPLPIAEHGVTVLDEGGPAHTKWLLSSWEKDAEESLQQLANIQVDWLVVDHYALDFRWENRMQGICAQIMVIDDLADRKHECNLLLDQNLGRDKQDYNNLIPLTCELLIGPSYSLLRPEFFALRGYSLQRREKGILQKILITMGGIDKNNATGEILDALENSALPATVHLIIVMGANAPFLKKIQERAVGLRWKTEVLVNTSDMARLMAECDLAIGAAGSTSWERCALGVPTWMMVLADNQKEVASHLERLGVAALIPESRNGMYRFFEKEVNQAVKNPREYLSTYVASASKVCDGRGVYQVIDKLMESKKDVK
ncbi:UDP-2,4-diacetamido-2,4,6-trideoxy-beta-L-altropyranose hydrolase [Alcaligenaceae bacterium 429]|nr:UDP-2,4-diacetamido-2,4,6-trideoxy-beta-L-altropyranose hydrolase [Alcaligenaceae bacterium 429]